MTVATDWLESLREQGEIAKGMAKAIPEALGHPALTIDQASRIHALAEKRARNIDSLVNKMGEANVDDSLIEAAEALQGIWDALAVAAANKVRALQGLDPIEFPDDEEE